MYITHTHIYIFLLLLIFFFTVNNQIFVNEQSKSVKCRKEYPGAVKKHQK